MLPFEDGMVRPKVASEDRRESLTTRLPNWLLYWLLKQKTSSGKLIEEALIQHFELTKGTTNQIDS